MDPLSGGSRLSRLPPVFAGSAAVAACRAFLCRRAGVAALTATLAVVTGGGAASAATYHAHDGTSLQAAVASADASSAASTIELSSGEFLPTSTLMITRDVTIVGPSSAPAAKLAGTSVEPFPSDLLLVEAGAKLTLSNVELTGGGGGGTAAAIDDLGAVDLESSTVAGNSGPGLLVEPRATAMVLNSTLSDGRDFGLVDDGSASLVSSTVAENVDGGVDDSAGALKLTNTIVAVNRGSDCTEPATASDHSLDSDGSCGVGALSRVDPLLGPLTANGGPTLTQALGPGSPAIGAGDDSKCPRDDQRHFARPTGHCDVGAFDTGAVQHTAQTGPGGPGSVSGSPAGSGAGALVAVSGHGTLRGARRSRITFSIRAEVGHSQAKLVYTDHVGHVVLATLILRSMAIDGRLGVATLRGRVLEMPSRKRVDVTVVLVSHSGRRSLRIRLSNGYYKSGSLLNGSIAFTRAA